MCNLNHLQKVDYEEVEQGKYFNQNGSHNDDIHQGVQSILWVQGICSMLLMRGLKLDEISGCFCSQTTLNLNWMKYVGAFVHHMKFKLDEINGCFCSQTT
jgi:hypothetical protein